MAPLRSSRSNRHLQQDTGPPGRVRAGVVDHDPMEGLPVRRWEMMEVTIKQEVKDDEKNHESKEGTNPDWPWPDLPLPKDFHLLPAHSQELLRRARAPNKNPNIAVFNRLTCEYERPNLNPSNPAAMTAVTKAPTLQDNNTQSSSDPANPRKDIDHDAAEPNDNLDTDKPPHEEAHERTIIVKRWVALPQSIADKKPEPKYLADRRPGLPPLYGHHTAANTSTPAPTGYAPNISSTLQNSHSNVQPGDVVIGSVPISANHAATVSGYGVSADGSTIPLGPGFGSGPGGGRPGVPGHQVEVPKRRPPPPPPRRKKKGGPGKIRRKVETAARGLEGSGRPGVVADAIGGRAAGTDAGAGAGARQREDERANAQPSPTTGGVPSQAQHGVSGESKTAAQDVEMADAEEDSSSTEDEGSEEGEIDEGAAAAAAAAAVAAGDGTNAPSAPIHGTEEEAAPGTSVSVSLQPPSPDLLGNLETEIQGMQDAAPPS